MHHEYVCTGITCDILQASILHMNISGNLTHITEKDLCNLPVFYNSVCTHEISEAQLIFEFIQKYGLIMGKDGNSNISGFPEFSLRFSADEILYDRINTTITGEISPDSPNYVLFTGWSNQLNLIRKASRYNSIEEYFSEKTFSISDRQRLQRDLTHRGITNENTSLTMQRITFLAEHAKRQLPASELSWAVLLDRFQARELKIALDYLCHNPLGIPKLTLGHYEEVVTSTFWPQGILKKPSDISHKEFIQTVAVELFTSDLANEIINLDLSLKRVVEGNEFTYRSDYVEEALQLIPSEILPWARPRFDAIKKEGRVLGLLREGKNSGNKER
jgi:hypothetical protein